MQIPKTTDPQLVMFLPGHTGCNQAAEGEVVEEEVDEGSAPAEAAISS